MKRILFASFLVASSAFGQAVQPGGGGSGGGGGSTIASTTNVIKGDGAGNGVAATPGTDYVIPSGTVANATGVNGASVPASAPCTATNASGQFTSTPCLTNPQPQILSDSNTTPNYSMQFTSTGAAGTGTQPGSTGITSGYNCLGVWTTTGASTYRAFATCVDNSSQMYWYRTAAAVTFGSESWSNVGAMFTGSAQQLYISGYLTGNYLYAISARGVRANSAFLDFSGGARLVGSGSNSSTYGSASLLAETSTGTAGCSFIATGAAATGTETANCPITAPFFLGSGTAPTMAAGAAAGTTPTCTTVTGNNAAGVISCTTGTATTTGTLATITFNGTLTTAPQGCRLEARNAATTPVDTSVYTTAPSTTTWTIAAATALSASTAYVWSFQCM